MPFLVVPMEEPPSSISLSPSTIWWKSKTRMARSEMKRRLVQSRPEEVRLEEDETRRDERYPALLELLILEKRKEDG